MENVVIIGTGPAGYTAAIYAARATLAPILIAGLQPGGQPTTTSIVENYPGFSKGIDGNKLMEEMKVQAESMGSRFRHGTVISIERLEHGFRIKTDMGKSIETKTVIVATGATARTLDLPHKDKLMGYGLSTCATCDGFFYRNKKVAVVGGGDSAMEEANYLAKLASEVTLIHRRESFRASKVMQERVVKNEKIKVVLNTQVVDTLSNPQGLTGIVLEDIKGRKSELPVDGLFMAIGHDPNTKFSSGLVEMDDQGYIRVHNGTFTNVPGIFAAGDVEDHVFRQAVTAAARGCQAAMQVERYLEAVS